MTYTIALAALLISLPAFAEHTFEAEAQLLQDTGLQLNGIVRWIQPAEEKFVLRWGTHLTAGATENTRLVDNTSTAAADYLFAGGGFSFIGKTSMPAVSALSEMTLGLDGINLKTSSGENAKHLLFKVHTGVRLEGSSKTFYVAGISFFNRSLPAQKPILVNGQLLSKYSLSPSVGFGAQF